LWEYIGRVGQPVTSPLLNRERTGPGRGGTVPILLSEVKIAPGPRSRQHRQKKIGVDHTKTK